MNNNFNNNIEINFFASNDDINEIVTNMLNIDTELNKKNKFKVGQRVMIDANYNELYNFLKIGRTTIDAKKDALTILSEKYGVIQGSGVFDDIETCYMVSFPSYGMIPIPEKFLRVF